VVESLMLFSELLGYIKAPKSVSLAHHIIYGKLEKKSTGEFQFGPFVLYNLAENRVMVIESRISSQDKEKLLKLKSYSSGEKEAAVSDGDSFEFLKNVVLKLS